MNNHKNINGLSAGTEYTWQVKTLCSHGPLVSSEWSAKQFFTTNNLKSAEEIIPATIGAYPNPFTSSTTITFAMEESQNVMIELCDLAGRKLETILDENIAAGSQEISFDGRQLPTGIYLLKMKTRSSTITQSIIIQ